MTIKSSITEKELLLLLHRNVALLHKCIIHYNPYAVCIYQAMNECTTCNKKWIVRFCDTLEVMQDYSLWIGLFFVVLYKENDTCSQVL